MWVPPLPVVFASATNSASDMPASLTSAIVRLWSDGRLCAAFPHSFSRIWESKHTCRPAVREDGAACDDHLIQAAPCGLLRSYTYLLIPPAPHPFPRLPGIDGKGVEHLHTEQNHGVFGN